MQNEFGWEWQGSAEPAPGTPTHNRPLCPHWAKETVENGFYFAQAIPNPSHTLRPNTFAKDLRRPRPGKGWKEGVSSAPWREEEEEEDESTAGFNPRTSGQLGGSVGAVTPISQDRLP